jgi:RNA polymerase sigma-70 factor (ECF subfamily)
MPVRSAPDAPLAVDLESLMSAWQQADHEAATTLIERLTPLLLRYFRAQAAYRRHAEDLVQETWIRVHKARHTWRPREPVLPWIFAIARHTGLDGYRRSRRVEMRETQVDKLPHVAAPEPRSAAADSELDALLAELPHSQREVIVMLKVSGMSIEEVARATAASAGSVKQKAHRAYAKLREILSQKGRTR